jgi:hypothetical protein
MRDASIHGFPGSGAGRRRRLPAFLAGVVVPLVIGLPGAGATTLTTPALLDSLQQTAFNYFWLEANPANGLIKDRSTPASPASIASVGFGLSAICIGIDHGWITRDAGQARVLTTLDWFWNAPQGSTSTGTTGYKGLFYHFLDMNTGLRVWNSELSTIDTALLMCGVLDAKQYFDTSDPDDVQIRALADSLYRRADWDFMRASGVGIRLGWNPESGFNPFGNWVGYNEAMILYILAIGSPTHPVPASTWFTWTSGYNWSTEYGYTYLIFPPLFGHQYSHCWIDFRGIQDIYMRSKGITYFENSRRATLAQRAYCIANPGGHLGYGADVWGITACDDPFVGYLAHGAPPAQNDNGTIAPTAAAASIAFAPNEVIPTLHYFYDNFQADLWGPYGFRDAFNLGAGWWDTDYLGIDQGPQILMIENYLNQRVWSRFMQDPDVQNGLALAGFLGATGVGSPSPAAAGAVLLQNAPNPFRTSATITYRLAAPGHARLGVYDVLGRRVRTLVDGSQSAGEHRVTLQREDLPAGTYFYRLEANGETHGKRFILLD